MCPGLTTAFKHTAILKAEGRQRLQLIEASGAGVASGMALLLGADTLDPNWTGNPHVQEYHTMISNGGKSIQGPLLVIHGENDDKISAKGQLLQ